MKTIFGQGIARAGMALALAAGAFLGTTTTAAEAQNAAAVYQHCNYGGYGVALGPGRYDMGQLARMGVRNDDLSSLRVGRGYEVTLHEHAGFRGQTLRRTASDGCLVNEGWNDRVSSIVVSRVQARAPVPAPAQRTPALPAGVLELRHEAGFVATFTVTWLEPTRVGNQMVPMPRVWSSGNVTLGWNHAMTFPAGSKNVTVIAEAFKFIGVKEGFYSRSYATPPTTCTKIWGTVFKPTAGGCSKNDFTKHLGKVKSFINRQDRLVRAVTAHIKARRVDLATQAVTRGDMAAARQHLDLPGLFASLKRQGLIASAEGLGPRRETDFAALPAQPAVFRPRDAADAGIVRVRNGDLLKVRTVSLAVGGNASVLMGGSVALGGTFLVDGSNVATKGSGLVSFTWNVCCGAGASVGLVVGLWTDAPLDMAGKAWGISFSLGYYGGITVTGWYPYNKPNAGPLGMEISIDVTTPSADAAYVRGWTCTYADTNRCKL